MTTAEPTLAIIDCVLPGGTSARHPSALDSLCGRPIVLYPTAAALQVTHGRVLIRVHEDEAASCRGLTGGESRVSVVDDAALAHALSRAGDGFAVVIRGHLALENSEQLLRAIEMSRPGREGPVALVELAALRSAFLASPTSADAVGLPLVESTASMDSATTDMGLMLVTDCQRLAVVEAQRYAQTSGRLRQQGVTIRGQATIDADVVVEPGAIIEAGVCLRGSTRIGRGARIDVGSVLTDVLVGPKAFVKPYTVATRASIGEAAEVGPFSHLRDGSDIHRHARIGNFVETKNVVVRERAMANHLAYMGDGDVGEGANISAGTIFCNSDGVNKHRTEVGERAFVGSDCQLVAPVKIGAGAFVATGTTVTEDVPPDALAISRTVQTNRLDYAPRLRAKFAAIAAQRKGGQS